MTPMREKRTWRRISAPALVSILLLTAGCITKTATEDDNSSNTIITVVSMTAGAAGATSTSGDDLFSDVCDNGTTTGCVAINDNAVVEMVGQVKDQTQPFSTSNDVIFTRYRVTFVRADGRNVAGVDVPYPFDGAANFTVSADGTSSSRALVVVRQQAKLEPPLRELRFDGARIGGALVLSTIAQIDFYGQDVAGRPVKVTAYLNVTFGDF
jgi:hypothetical protein